MGVWPIHAWNGGRETPSKKLVIAKVPMNSWYVSTVPAVMALSVIAYSFWIAYA
jgi:hypothetical protein